MTIKLTGEVVRPGDSGYEAARIGWNRLYSRYPEAIVFCNVAQDVVNAVEWARQKGTALRARSGRHSLNGWSALDGGLVVDVSRMKSVTIDETTGTALVGTGLTQKEIVPALGQRGFVIPTGSEGGGGLGGVVLGGGVGLLTRNLGLASDNLLAAEVVVPDGARSAKVVQATEHSNSDLLWACRGGGGGNFGIATSYTLKLHELEHVEFAIARWTGHEHLGELLRTWQRDAPFADERLTSALEVDSTAVELSAVLHGGSRQELDDGLRSLLAIGKPKGTYMNDAWPIIYQYVDRAPDLPFWKFYSQFVKRPFPPQSPNKSPGAAPHDRFCGPQWLRRSQLQVVDHLLAFVVAQGESRRHGVQPGRVAPLLRAHGASPPFQRNGARHDCAAREPAV